MYLLAFLAVQALAREKDIKLTYNIPRAFLVIVFGFATFHKIFSEYFRSGRLVASYILDGSSLDVVRAWLFPGFLDKAWDTLDQSREIAATSNMLEPLTAPIEFFDPNFVIFCKVLAIAIILAELVVFAVFAKKSWFFSTWSPYVVLSFIVGTLLFTNENTFFSILMILFLLARPNLPTFWNRTFMLSIFTLLILSLMEFDISL
jgi:hypothetical protein